MNADTSFRSPVLAKFITIFLLVGFLISPISVVFAQETQGTGDASTPPAGSGTGSQTDQQQNQDNPTDDPDKPITPPGLTDTDPPPEKDPKTPPEDLKKGDDTDKKEDKKEEELQNNAVAPSTTDGTSTAQNTAQKTLQAKTDLNSGALIFNYPIVVSPGRNGLTPDLSLKYNSQRNDNSSIISSGWELSIPYIVRKNTRGVDQLYNSNDYTSSEDGDLKSILVNGSVQTFLPESQNPDFPTYTLDSSTDTWKILFKNGTVMTFGDGSQSRVDDPANPTHIYKWMLKKVQDKNGNFINYTYYKEGGQIYPETIKYTGNNSDEGIFKVNFSRLSSPVVIPDFSPGFNVSTSYHISQIQSSVGDSWVHKYNLTYTAENPSSHLQLTSIIENGQTNNVVTTLPATTFTYQTAAPGWTSGPNQNFPPEAALLDAGKQDTGYRLFDVNGDGLPDVASSNKAYVNTVYGWTLDPSWILPVSFLQANDNGYRIVDVNGDNLTDIVSNTQSYINNGHGWTQDSSWNAPVSFTDSTGYDNGTRIVDINGDGLPDIVYSYVSQNGPNDYRSYINTGHGWALDQSWILPVILSSWNYRDNGYRIQDVNGDNLVDIVSNIQSYINNGHGWTQDSSWNAPVSFVDFTNSGSRDTGARIFDVNGDNLADFVSYSATYGSKVYINTGRAWTLDPNWVFPFNFVDSLGRDTGTRVTDLNGDGLVDLVNSVGVVGHPIAHFNVYINNLPNPNLLTQITYPQGGNTKVTYKPGAQYTDGSINPINKIPFPLNIVSKITTNDGSTASSSLSYDYTGGKYFYNGPYDKKFAGFNKVTEKDYEGNTTTTFYHQGDTSDSSHGEYNDDAWKIGKPYRIETANNLKNIYSKTVNKWDSINLGNGSKFVKLAQSLGMTYDGDSTHKDKAEAYTYDDTNGNIIQKIEYGEVAGNDDGTFTDSGTDDFTTTYFYAANPSLNTISLPDYVNVADHTSVTVKESRFYYDNLALGQLSKGNMTKQEDWKSGIQPAPGSITSPTIPAPISPKAKVLVIGGGGGGWSGGGGAGGYQYDAAHSLTSSAYYISIGAGGLGGGNGFPIPTKGNNSSFDNITALGGGSGGGNFNMYSVALNVGSGGGGSYYSDRGGIGSQGGNGGGAMGNGLSAGGGGGSSGNGGNGPNSLGKGGDGGPGTVNSISGSAITYAGGGGGGAYSQYQVNTGGTGGEGGGGRGGSNDTQAQSGTNGLGGGGGGGRKSNYENAGSGGSGIVIISYATDGSDGISPSSTGGTKTTAGDQTIHTFLNNGTFFRATPAPGTITSPQPPAMSGEYINTQKVYNSYGLITSSTDAKGKITNFTYDSSNLYITSVTNALNQTTNLTYDYASGQVIQKTDPNGRIFQSTYDGLGRLLTEKQTDITPTAAGSNFSSATLGASPLVSPKVKVLAIGGGGGGWSGGGGAGGYQYDALHVLTSPAYYVSIGAGGIGGNQSSTPSATNGSNSLFDNITALGGGRGGRWSQDLAAGSGGSGGGNIYYNPAGTGTQGGNGVTTNFSLAGGGGGGAGGDGQINSGSTGGAGGPGIANSISGVSVTYAGGGGGQGYGYGGGPGAGGAGGVGGGGHGGSYQDAQPGTNGLGGGGGGLSNNLGNGAPGGSGIVIISYATDGSDGISPSSTGGTKTTVGDQTIHTFLSNGTFTITPVQAPPPSPLSSDLVLKTSYTYTDTPNNTSIQKTDYLDDGTNVDSYIYFDGLGRKIQERKETESEYSVKDYIYNIRGLLDKESLSYFSSGTSKTSPSTTASLYINYTYDPLQRVLTTVNSLGTTTNTYSDWKLTVTDANGKTKDLYKDAYMNLLQVDEHNSESTYSTYYTFDYLGNPTKITDALGNIRNFTYDGLGRRLTAEDLHANADATFGTYTFTYDNNGNLTQVVDPKNQTTNYTYDAINRPLSKDYMGTPGTEVTYTYDTGTDGIGRLTGITTNTLNQTNAYNALGGVKNESKIIDGTTYTTSYDYDRLGNQILITNPDDSQVKYIYNSAGLLEKVQRKENTDTSYMDVVTNFDYSPTGQIKTIAYPNGITTTNTYDADKLYRLTSKVSERAASSLQNLSDLDTVGTRGAATKVIHTDAAAQAIPLTVKALVIAGGGSGGSGGGTSGGGAGGGGAGGMIYDNAYPVTARIYQVTVGNGGIHPAIGTNSVGQNGGNSIFGTLSTIGGGGGGKGGTSLGNGGSGNSGGSGGGGSQDVGYGGAGTTNQGNKGGDSGASGTNTGAGGGGAGGAGANMTPYNTVGGIGLSNSITGSAVIYAKGGDGSPHAGQSVKNGTLNKGEGGGGNNFSAAAGDGGSGVVIISYVTENFAEYSITGGTITTNGTNTIHTFNSSGTFTISDLASPNSNPVITLNGSSLINLNTGSTWTEPGYIATDTEDGNITSSVTTTGLVNTSVDGTYQLVYSVVDSQGSQVEVMRAVVVHSPGAISDLQNLSYTYDAVGNITQIIDASNTDTSKVSSYTYDDLYRLTSATVTGVATGQTPYTENYTYNAIGNILTKSGQGNYVYTGTGYANPHAVTSINLVTNTYDNNGNLLTDGTLTNTWNYKNQLTQAVKGEVTSTYTYDHVGQRVKVNNGTTTTIYPSKFYNTDGMTATKHIFANGIEVGVITGTGSEAVVRYIQTDHLTGSNVVTDSTGTIIETTDYYPFGSIRLDQKAGSFSEQRKFIGQEYDNDTSLSYLNARYYDGGRGQFISQDSVFLAVGNNVELQAKTGLKLEQYLSDPQSLNSYSYARNNPLVFVDTTGEFMQAVNRPVQMFGTTIGAHSFIEIRDNPNINNGQRTTLGGYTNNFIFGDLFKGENYYTDYDLSESDYLSTHELKAPEGYTQQEFEKKVYDSYNSIDNDLGAYSPFGGDLPNGQGNSGNVFTQILLGAGFTKDQISSLKTKGSYDAGVGRGIPTNKVQSLSTQIKNLKSYISTIEKNIRDKVKK